MLRPMQPVNFNAVKVRDFKDVSYVERDMVLVTVAGIVMLVRLLQPLNAELPMLVRLPAAVTLFRLVQP